MFLGRTKAVKSLSMESAGAQLLSDSSIALIDVRTKGEYARGHIPGSIHIPLDMLFAIDNFVPDKSAKIFVYCLSGARSGQACLLLSRSGYSDVTNIGGVTQWKGELAKAVGA
ncbi:MAG: rhodanese-like domain-containing protein [Christensenellales bacterium]